MVWTLEANSARIDLPVTNKLIHLFPHCSAELLQQDGRTEPFLIFTTPIPSLIQALPVIPVSGRH